MRVPQEFDYKKDKTAILSWHYKLFLRLDEELMEDSRARKSCRYCGCSNKKCKCNSYLRFYWAATKLLSLVMPSSGAVERVSRFYTTCLTNSKRIHWETCCTLHFSWHTTSAGHRPKLSWEESGVVGVTKIMNLNEMLLGLIC